MSLTATAITTTENTIKNTSIGAMGFFAATQLGVGAVAGVTLAGVAGASALGYVALLPARWLIDFCAASNVPAISGEFAITHQHFYQRQLHLTVSRSNDQYFNRAYSYNSLINLAHNVGAAAFGAAALGLPTAPIMICAVLGYVLYQTMQPILHLLPSLTTMLILGGIGLGIAAYANPAVAATLTAGMHAFPGALHAAPSMATNALHAAPALLQATLNVYANIMHASISGLYAVPGLLNAAFHAAINALQAVLAFGSQAIASAVSTFPSMRMGM